MKNFYKIENGQAVIGAGLDVPKGFIEFDPSDKPQDLIDAIGNDNSERLHELKKLLNDSDYKVLPDYDKDSTQIKKQRQAWREEIRTLEDA